MLFFYAFVVLIQPSKVQIFELDYLPQQVHGDIHRQESFLLEKRRASRDLVQQ
jgi:hypothetical protein